MSQAAAEVAGYVSRSRAFMPPGTVPPFVTRFDAGSVPVGQLVFTSETRTLGEIQDLALLRVRPMFSTLPGVSAPPPLEEARKRSLSRLIRKKCGIIIIHLMRSCSHWHNSTPFLRPAT